MPRISVIMPAYNAGAFLRRSVGSVISQTFQDWELVIIDDGSVDGTAELADKLAADDKRIRVIHQHNSGVSCARNSGIAAARGEFISFLDADDEYLPTFLAELLTAVDENDADCAACSHFRLYPDGRREPDVFPLPEGVSFEEDILNSVTIPLLADRISAELFNGFVWRYLFSRRKITDNRITFTGAYLEDELFLIEYFSHPTVLAVVGKALCLYTQNPDSATRRYMPDCVDVFLRSLELKRELVSRFDIPVPSWWEHNTAWAGLLIAIGNIFAPGSPATFREKLSSLRELAAVPEFHTAVESYSPAGMNRNKTVVARLFAGRRYMLLELLYKLKNKN